MENFSVEIEHGNENRAFLTKNKNSASTKSGDGTSHEVTILQLILTGSAYREDQDPGGRMT